MRNEDSTPEEGIVPRVAYLALGSNLGDRSWNISEAIARLRADDRIRVVRAAEPRETAPMYVTDQPEFLNTCVQIETTHDPMALLDACLTIEKEMGRERVRKNGPRIIDVDILLYADRVIDERGLQIPHPAMLERDFVLAPLSEIAPDVKHPTAGVTIAEAWRALAD